MPIVEEDCRLSTAVERLAFNTANNSVYVQFRDDAERRVYEYLNTPASLLLMISDKAIYKGRLVAMIKAFLKANGLHFKILQSFPVTDKSEGALSTHPKGQSQLTKKNFTASWIAVISSPTQYPRQYLERLLPLLDSLIAKGPRDTVSRPPLRFRKQHQEEGGSSRLARGLESDDSSTSSLPTVASTSSTGINSIRSQADSASSLGNSFAALLIDDDISDDDDSIDPTADSASDEDVGCDDVDVLSSDTSLQSRYLRHMLVCSIAENMRHSAIEAIKSKDYYASYSAFEGAYMYINMAIVETSLWFAILQEGLENTTADLLRDDHSKSQLVSLFENMHLIRDDSERSRENALSSLTLSLARIEKKLMDLMMSRDAMKQKMGGSWKAPKQGGAFKLSPLAEQLKLMEIEARAIADAINGLKRLALVV